MGQRWHQVRVHHITTHYSLLGATRHTSGTDRQFTCLRCHPLARTLHWSTHNVHHFGCCPHTMLRHLAHTRQIRHQIHSRCHNHIVLSTGSPCTDTHFRCIAQHILQESAPGSHLVRLVGLCHQSLSELSTMRIVPFLRFPAHVRWANFCQAVSTRVDASDERQGRDATRSVRRQ